MPSNGGPESSEIRHEVSGTSEGDEATTGRVVSLAFLASTIASIGLVIVYLAGGHRASEGLLLGAALGGMGVGIVGWTRLLGGADEVEQRQVLSSDEPADVAVAIPEGVSRRTLLVRLLAAAGGALAAALAIPTLSLGPRPGQSLYRTQWRKGARVVDENGSPLRPEDIGLDSVITVFPEGVEGSADSQTLLLRVEEDLLELDEDRSEWAPQGCIAYSKICTHAGCPVGLYRAEAHELLCPCHQSTFDVLHGARPVFGPAARPLPQLPMEVGEDGYLRALDDFTEPVGPSFWNVHS